MMMSFHHVARVAQLTLSLVSTTGQKVPLVNASILKFAGSGSFEPFFGT
jgi:hypothetical protein